MSLWPKNDNDKLVAIFVICGTLLIIVLIIAVAIVNPGALK